MPSTGGTEHHRDRAIAMLAGREALIKNGNSKTPGSTNWNPKSPCSERNCGSTGPACGVSPQTDGRNTTSSNEWPSCSSGHAWLEQNRNGSPLLCIRRHRPIVAATS